MQARKPDFFTYNMSLYQIVTEDGLMRPCMVAKKGGLFCGGSARMVEKALELEGDDILYVGDHVSWDTHFCWRSHGWGAFCACVLQSPALSGLIALAIATTEAGGACQCVCG